MIERAIFFGSCVVAYVLAHATRRLHRAPVLLVAGALVAIALLVLGRSHADAFRAAISPFSLLLGPMTVALAIPLERARGHGAIPVGRSIALLGASAAGGVAVALGLARLVHATPLVRASIAPRAATSALSVPTAEALGGSASVTSVVVVVTGVAVAVVGPAILRACGVRNASARGLALGAAGHLVATARAYEESEEAGAASSFALVVHGVLTVLASFAARSLGLL